MTNKITIDLYLVGEDEDDAQSCLPFDSEHSARTYALDQPGPVSIYEVQAEVDFTTMTLVEALSKGRQE